MAMLINERVKAFDRGDFSYGVFLLPVVFGAWGIGTAVSIAWRRWGWRESIYAHYEVLKTRASVQVAPLATNFHYEMNSEAGEPPLALPAPVDVIKPMAEWMAWVDDQPHTLLGGKTRAGKTWLATTLLERRIDSGADIFIIDPHSSDWMGLPAADDLPIAGGSGKMAAPSFGLIPSSSGGDSFDARWCAAATGGARCVGQ